MKIKVQAQHLQPGDIVGSGKTVHSVIVNSIRWPSNKVCIIFKEGEKLGKLWGKYTMINVERADAKVDG